MTRPELHNTQGFHPQSILAAALYLRTNLPRIRFAGDATAIIKNEGHMNGFLDAIEALETAALPEPPKGERKVSQPYSAPPQPQTENLNQK